MSGNASLNTVDDEATTFNKNNVELSIYLTIDRYDASGNNVANEDKDVEHFQVRVREFSIEPPVRIVKPPRLFNLDDLEEEE